MDVHLTEKNLKQFDLDDYSIGTTEGSVYLIHSGYDEDDHAALADKYIGFDEMTITVWAEAKDVSVMQFISVDIEAGMVVDNVTDVKVIAADVDDLPCTVSDYQPEAVKKEIIKSLQGEKQ